MAAPRSRYLAIVNGDMREFRARPDEIEERLNEAVNDTWGQLDPDTQIIVVRYTQVRQFVVKAVEPIMWMHKMKESA